MTDSEVSGSAGHGVHPHHGRPTLRTIAEMTGLAVATVSRALKDAPDIGEATKKKVRAVAKQVGYRPNRAGVRLRTGKTNVISLVLCTEENVMNHTAQLMYALSATLRDTAYHMNVTPYSSRDDFMAPIRYVVETGSADGIVLNQTRPDDERIRYLHEHGFPFATHGRTDMGLAHPYFDFDNQRYVELCVDELVKRGRRRIALLSPPGQHNYARHMRAGLERAAPCHGVRWRVIDGVTSDTPMAEIERVMGTVMAGDDYPDGLIGGSTSATMAMVAAAEAAGRVLGRDFDMAAKEAVPILRHFRRELIIFHEDVGRAGTFLAGALMAAIEGRTGPDLQHLDVPTAPEAPR